MAFVPMKRVGMNWPGLCLKPSYDKHHSTLFQRMHGPVWPSCMTDKNDFQSLRIVHFKR